MALAARRSCAPDAAAGGGDAIGGKKRRRASWLEPLLWLAAGALVSPLAIYAGRPVMPLVGLYGVAAGIALALALAGRRLHAALLSDALRDGGGTGRALMAVGMMLLVLFLILLGAVVAVLLLFRAGRGPESVPGLL